LEVIKQNDITKDHILARQETVLISRWRWKAPLRLVSWHFGVTGELGQHAGGG